MTRSRFWLLLLIALSSAAWAQAPDQLMSREDRIRMHHDRIERIIQTKRLITELREKNNLAQVRWSEGSSTNTQLALVKAGVSPADASAYTALGGQIVQLMSQDGATTSPQIWNQVTDLFRKQDSLVTEQQLSSAADTFVILQAEMMEKLRPRAKLTTPTQVTE